MSSTHLRNDIEKLVLCVLYNFVVEVFVALAQVEHPLHHEVVHLAVLCVGLDVEPNVGIDGTPHATVPHNVKLLNLYHEKSFKRDRQECK